MLSKTTTTLILGATAVLAASVSADSEGGHAYGYKTTTAEVAGPEDWHTHYPLCGGSKQSPIDITFAAACGEEIPLPWGFNGTCTTFSLTESEKGYTAAVVDGDCAATANDMEYRLRQFHLHTPSEHKVAGKDFDGEIHFVHGTEGANETDSTDDNKNLMVVGVFLNASDDATTAPWLATVLQGLETVTTSNPVDLTLTSYADFAAEFAALGQVFNYEGSLTTPGCDEIVDWWVVKTPAPISTDDLTKLEARLASIEVTDEGKNARPVQALNGRTIKTYN